MVKNSLVLLGLGKTVDITTLGELIRVHTIIGSEQP